MANWSKTMNTNLGRFPACNGSWGDCWAQYYMEGTLSFSRNTSDATKAWVHGNVYMRCSGSQLGWATPSGNIRLTPDCYDVDGVHHYDYWGGKGGKCHQNFNYNHTHDCWYALRSGTGQGRDYIGTHFIWGFTPTSSGADWQDVDWYNYYLPDHLRITPPQGLSASFPTSVNGTTSVSISGWGKASNMTGTPTSYPYASYWNFALDLLDKNKNYLAHITKNTGETKSTSFYGFGFYTASALQYSSAANNSLVTRKYNTAYYLRAYAQNSFNERVSVDSGIIYSPPKSPSVTINSILYQPSKKNCVMDFSWSKPSDESDYKETVSYRVVSSDGTVVKGWTTLGSTYGGALSGNVTVDDLKSGEVYTVEVRVVSTAGTSTASDNYVAPVANAAFLGFDWDELRRTVTVRAEAPGAANCRIQAGDQPNNYNLGNKLTSGEVGTIVLKDLPHGDGQALYLQAVPEASNGYQYTNEIAKVTVPVPNPILGVLTPPCDSPEEQRYIVDIVEKKADCSVTPKWQVGDRVVVKDECPSDPVGGGVGIYNVSVIGRRTDGVGRGVFTLKGRFTPGTDITKVKLDRRTHMGNGVKYALSIAGRDFEVTADTTQSNYTYAYAFSVFLAVGDHDSVGDGVNEIGFAYPNSNGVFVGSNNSYAPKPTFEYCYDVVDSALEPWSKQRQATLSCFPVGASEPNEVPIIQEINTCS